MLITLEGIEGAGKTSQIRPIVSHLESAGRACLVTREPGGTAIGEKIRAILLDPVNRAMDPVAELLLYMADRAQHIGQVMGPALEAGTVVICDRYVDATIAYQGYARQLDKALIHRLHELLFSALIPDITLLLDLPVRVGLQRAWQGVHQGQRCPGETRFEEEALAFHERVRAGYLALARREPHRFHVIDAGQPPERVTDQILRALSRAMAKSESGPGSKSESR
jgi:dTMP kinase